jgi:hypothetical protein
MADQWYYARGGTTFGPFSAAQLKELAAAGQIQAQDGVWKEGMDRRVPAAKVKQLFPERPRPAAATASPPSAPAAETTRPPGDKASEATVPAERPADSAAPERVAGEDAGPTPAAEDQPAAQVAAEPPPAPKPPPQEVKRVKRVLSVKGGDLVTQDGEKVKYRKRCLKCNQPDTGVSTMPIRPGTTRVMYFCPKCKKSQLTEVYATG